MAGIQGISKFCFNPVCFTFQFFILLCVNNHVYGSSSCRSLNPRLSLKYGAGNSLVSPPLTPGTLVTRISNTASRKQSLLELRGGSNYDSNGRGSSYYDYREEERDYYDNSRRPRNRDDYYDDGSQFNRGDYEDRNDNDDYYSPSRSKKKSGTSFTLPTKIPGITAPNRKVGFFCLGSGTAITFLGISLFFNKTLMRLGNILFLLGIPLTIGPGRTAGYFLQPKKSRATLCLAFGIFMVLVGHPVIGIAAEIFGLLNLFGNFFPLLTMFIRRVPFVGELIPDGSKKKKQKRSESYDREENGNYYGDDNSYYRDENVEQYY